jgi:hypothetical protein
MEYFGTALRSIPLKTQLGEGRDQPTDMVVNIEEEEKEEHSYLFYNQIEWIISSSLPFIINTDDD